LANDGSDNSTNLVKKSCIAGMCVYQTNITSTMDDIDMIPPGDNSLSRQICSKSIMAVGTNQTVIDYSLDFDQDGIPNALDPFTLFDPLVTMQTVTIPQGSEAVDSIIMEDPSFLNGTIRVLYGKLGPGFVPNQVFQIAPAVGFNFLFFTTSFPLEYTANATRIFPDTVSLEQLSFLVGGVGGQLATELDFTVSVKDENGEESSVTFVPPVDFAITPWSLDLRSNPNIDLGRISQIRIRGDYEGFQSPDPYIVDLGFKFVSESIIPVSDCMEHVAERQPNGDLLCSHYFTCSCPEPTINPILN